jgi:hypothetical protein
MKKDYEIGYGKPPGHTRFVKGKSGNPKGRPRKCSPGFPREQRSHMKDDMERLLQRQIHVPEGGRTKRITIQRAQIRGLVNRAIDGHTPSINQLWILIKRFGLDRKPDDIKVEQFRWIQRLINEAQNPDALNTAPKRANIMDDLLLELQEMITITERGKQKRITKQEALLRTVLAKSIGDASAFKLFWAIFQHYELDHQPEKLFAAWGPREVENYWKEVARRLERQEAQEVLALGGTGVPCDAGADGEGPSSDIPR